MMGRLKQEGADYLGLLAILQGAYRRLAVVVDMLAEGRPVSEIGAAMGKPGQFPNIRDMAIARARRIGFGGLGKSYAALVEADGEEWFINVRLPPPRLLIIGAVASIVRWSLFPLEFGYWGYVVLQAMHGLTFGANALGTQHLIAEIVPERMTASAQGIYSMFLGLLLATTTSLTGPIYGAFGINGFFFMVPFAAASLLICLAFRRYAAANRVHE